MTASFLAKVENAMDNHKCLVVKYHNQLRLVEPVAICGEESKPERVLVYQVNGDAPGYRMFILDAIQSVTLTDKAVSQTTLTTRANPALPVIRHI